ncbi:TorF family putative porin [Gimibacter soli]|uniref:TorF family putative porin n=1 Tax=Gimibacter soli TaxID=3024400 RepID=A0AAE9XT52_9PROT|nr:TorF family putative porin [Gimibacter soli]WCL53675.1 TorF family putative porin [Gimibacter soli]
MTTRYMLTALALVAAAPAVQASDIDLEGYVGVVSDYRDRGISLSDKDFAALGSVAAYHTSGLYGGMLAATFDDRLGGQVETEFFAGYRVDKGTVIYDISGELDMYHGDDGTRTLPGVRGSMARDFGLFFVRGGLAWSPEGRWHTPDVASLYAFSDLEVPVPNLPELTFVTRLGYDMRSDGRANLWDWGVGLSAFLLDRVELTLMYDDTSKNDPRASGTVSVGARFYF